MINSDSTCPSITIENAPEIEAIQNLLDEIVAQYGVRCSLIVGNPNGAPIERYGRGISYIQNVFIEPERKKTIQ